LHPIAYFTSIYDNSLCRVQSMHRSDEAIPDYILGEQVDFEEDDPV
jgi:hypothetical protein